MFDKFSSGIIIIDQFGYIQEINLYAMNQLGLEREELLQRPINVLKSRITIDTQSLFSLKEGLKNHQFVQVVCPIHNAKGDFKYLKVTIHLMDADFNYFIQIEDDTEKLTLKEQLAQSESLSNLGQLAASIAHEIRNPMTSLKGFTQLMQFETNEKGARYLKIIEQEIDRIDKILNEFLQLSKPKKFNMEIVDVQNLVGEVVEFMLPQALLAGVELKLISLSKISYFETDSILVKQILINSIKNAIEAMADGGMIYVQVTSGDGEIVISIHDEGPGIDLDKLQMYFEAFYTTKEYGTGLGLAHAAKVMKEMNGRIAVENNLAGGASFYFYFPEKQQKTF